MLTEHDVDFATLATPADARSYIARGWSVIRQSAGRFYAFAPGYGESMDAAEHAAQQIGTRRPCRAEWREIYRESRHRMQPSPY